MTTSVDLVVPRPRSAPASAPVEEPLAPRLAEPIALALVLLPVAYASAFDIEVLNETDLARVAELARRAEDEERERLW